MGFEHLPKFSVSNPMLILKEPLPDGISGNIKKVLGCERDLLQRFGSGQLNLFHQLHKIWIALKLFKLEGGCDFFN
jgi:hypothetical protein